MGETTENTMKEIPNYPGYMITEDGTIYGKKHGTPMYQHTSNSGHKQVKLCKQGKQKSFKVHRLVLLTFVGEPELGQECCHNDGNPANNRLDNLRWDTIAENRKDRAGHGTGIKFTDADVKDILWLSSMRVPQKEIGRMFNINYKYVSELVTGVKRLRVTSKEGV